MEDEQMQLMWILFVALLAHSANSICPVRCICDDASLKVSCVAANLEVIPIQLNPAIQIINLSANRITDVHYTLSIYSNLIELNLSRNRIESLGSSNFELQYNLKFLFLDNNVISKLLKDSFKGLKNLIVLDLSYNYLTELPIAAFRELSSLRILKVKSNRLQYLETDLLKFTVNLEKLYLDDNQLMQIPVNAISEGARLQYLSLTQNLMKSIEEVPFLPKLRILLLNTNILNYISPSAFVNLKSLDILDLSDNNFTYIPTDCLSKLSNLRKLYLSGNFLQNISAVAFRGLFHLKYLYVDRLEVLSFIDIRAFVDNINLEKIWLDNNIAFRSLPENMFHGNPKIKEISITNNYITTLDVSHFPLDNLNSLNLGGNPLECNCSLFWLWQLLKKQTSQDVITINNSSNKGFLLDIRNISCATPEFLSGKLLVDVKESELMCSLKWPLAFYLSLLFIAIIGVVYLLIYWGVIKRHLDSKAGPSRSQLPPKAEPSHSHYTSVPTSNPYTDSPEIKYVECTRRLLLPKINDSWSFPSNVMQIPR